MSPGVFDSGWTLWFTGLPGSGKSTIARAVHTALVGQGRDVAMLVMDERRKSYFPKPAYTAEERAQAYALIAREAAERHLGVVAVDGRMVDAPVVAQAERTLELARLAGMEVPAL